MILIGYGRLRALLGLAVALATLSIVANATAATHRHAKKHHRHHLHHVVRKSTIGPGGDGDADNHGAPSDGDGNF